MNLSEIENNEFNKIKTWKFYHSLIIYKLKYFDWKYNIGIYSSWETCKEVQWGQEPILNKIDELELTQFYRETLCHWKFWAYIKCVCNDGFSVQWLRVRRLGL